MSDLKPLRIPAGWTVSWNIFIDAEPSEDNFIVFDGATIFGAYHSKANRCIDMEFQPKDLELGRFVIVLFTWHAQGGPSKLLARKVVKTGVEAAKAIEEFMDVSIDYEPIDN